MSDDNTKLDISQRIAEAMNCRTKPIEPDLSELNPEDSIIGEVPEHLHHLFNLVDECANEVREAEKQLRALLNCHESVSSVFSDALDDHIPSEYDAYGTFKICKDWKIVGVSHNSNGKMINDIDAIMELIKEKGFRR